MNTVNSEFHVVDADGHVTEPNSLYDEYLDPSFRASLEALKEAASLRSRPGRRYFGYFDTIPKNRPLGSKVASEIPKSGRKTRAGGTDPIARLEDMDLEGIDVAVLFPTGVSSFCAVEDTAFESALYEAYARWIKAYCEVAPARLKGVAVVNMREPTRGAREIHRWARETWCVGIYCSGHVEEKLLDHPDLHPLWEAAEEEDLPVCIHGGTARPPYGCGTSEMAENFFLMHVCTNPFEQMRAMASLVGGGVLEKFPRLRVAFLEAGVGWVPYWMDRLDEHHELLPHHVPRLSRPPSEHLRGPQVFISCDPDEPTLETCSEAIGPERILYASDYPHFDSRFPNTVRAIAERPTLTPASKQKILGENAIRLYRKLEC